MKQRSVTCMEKRCNPVLSQGQSKTRFRLQKVVGSDDYRVCSGLRL